MCPVSSVSVSDVEVRLIGGGMRGVPNCTGIERRRVERSQRPLQSLWSRERVV
jgi:hypothetical protein